MKLENIIRMLTVACVVSSLVISIRSCNISVNSNKIASEANDIAKEAINITKAHFIENNRPQLVLRPKKFENGLFWDIFQNNTQIKIMLRYTIKNHSDVVAKGICLPGKRYISTKNSSLSSLSAISGENVTVITYQNQMSRKVFSLGPREQFYVEQIMLMEYSDGIIAKRNREFLLSNESKGIIFEISVDYTHALDPSKRYRTLMKNRIHNDKAEIIESDMFQLIK